MRIASDLLVVLLVTAVLIGLADMSHELLWPVVVADVPALAGFLHAALVAVALAPLFIVLLRQLHRLQCALELTGQRHDEARARVELLGEAVGAGGFMLFETDLDRDVVALYGGGNADARTFPLADWLHRVHADDLPPLERDLLRLRAGELGEVEHCYRVRTQDEEQWRWLRVHAQVSLRDHGGRARRLVGSACDITRERDAELRLTAGQRLLHSVLELLPVGVFWKDRDGRYLGANRAFLQHYGIADAVGLRDEEFVDPALADNFRQHDAAVMAGELEERNALREAVTADGLRRWYATSKVRLLDEDGGVLGIVGTFDDVTSLKHTEQRLRETSERFELALRGSSDGLWDWNLVTNDVYYSPQFKALLGYEEHEYGKDFAIFEAGLHVEDRPMIFDALERHLQNGDELDIEYRMRHHSGEWRWYRTRGLAVRDAAGVGRRMAGTLSDITERKARELEIAEARSHLSAAIETLDSAIVMFDAGQKLVFCNSRYCEFYSLPPALARPGTSYRDILAAFCERFPHMQRGRTPDDYAQELFARHRAGGTPWELELPERWLLVSERPTHDGGVVCLHTDITHIKRSQRALEQALERAEGANRSKSQFVANVSHELRTPLNGVLGMLQLLGDGGLQSPHDEYVRVALQAGRSLLELINDMLDFARNEAGIGEVGDEAFNLPLLVDEIVAAHTRRAANKGLHLLPFVEAAVPERVYGDPARIGQVLSNLLGNAIKFTERGEVRLEVRCDADEHDVLCLSVDDTGIGIPLEAQATIFEPFTQVDGSHSRRFGGTGLGLALTRQQIELMGGTLRVDSAVGRGSRFECRLRLRADPLEQVTAGGRALVVDARSPCLPALLACLERAGLRVLVVSAHDAATTALGEGVDWLFVDAALAAPELAALARLAARLGLRCAGYGVMADAPLEPALQTLLPEVLRTPLSYAAVCALLQSQAQLPRTPDNVEDALDEAFAGRLEEALGADGFAELIESFDDNLRTRLADYRDAVASGDAARVQRLTHAMKGVGANLGAARFAALCASVGHSAALGDLEDRHAQLAASFAAALSRLRDIAAQSGALPAQRAHA